MHRRCEWQLRAAGARGVRTREPHTNAVCAIRNNPAPRAPIPGSRHAFTGWCEALDGNGRRRSALVVLVVVAPPSPAAFVAALGRSVEPLVHAPEAVKSARIGRIGVIDDATLEHECAHAR